MNVFFFLFALCLIALAITSLVGMGYLTKIVFTNTNFQSQNGLTNAQLVIVKITVVMVWLSGIIGSILSTKSS